MSADAPARPRASGALLALLYAAMAAVAVLMLLRPANDPDFFWHLKTGEWIWQHRALPASDPFNYLSAGGDAEGQRFTLTAYWLAQVAYHLFHSLLGMPGIVALKFLLALLLALALLRLRRGDPVIHAALVLAILSLCFRIYTFDRPQVFSFIAFAALLALLERERRGAAPAPGWRSHLPLPALMLVWANLHGGHVLGQLTIAAVLALEGLKFAHPWLQPIGRERYRRLLARGGAGLAASLINPNSWHAVQIVLSPGPLWLKNEEYASTVTFFQGQPLVAVFWGLLALAALSVVATAKRPDLTSIALLAGLGYEGFVHVRYVPFFAILALPQVGSWLSGGRRAAWARPVLAAGAVALAALSTLDSLPTRDRLARALRVNEKMYPVGAADFVLANPPVGNLYNTYFWGGYLIWRLGPGRKVFVDGRALNPRPIFDGFTINMAFANPSDPPPLWKRLLRQHGIGYLILPRVRRSESANLDDVDRLRAALLQSPEWVPVFADPVSVVFVLNAPEHREIIARHAIPRGLLFGRPPGS